MAYEMPEPPTIEELSSMDDAQLSKALGFDQKLTEAKEAIKTLAGLPAGKEREHCEDRLQRMFTPRVYPEDLKYMAEDATRKKKTGKEELCCCEPTSVM